MAKKRALGCVECFIRVSFSVQLRFSCVIKRFYCKKLPRIRDDVVSSSPANGCHRSSCDLSQYVGGTCAVVSSSRNLWLCFRLFLPTWMHADIGNLPRCGVCQLWAILSLAGAVMLLQTLPSTLCRPLSKRNSKIGSCAAKIPQIRAARGVGCCLLPVVSVTESPGTRVVLVSANCA